MEWKRLWLGAIAGLLPVSPVMAENLVLTQGPIEMMLDPAAPELTCRVVRTSGDPATDDAACAAAAAEHRTGALPYPKGTYFYGDAERHPNECRLNGKPLPQEFGAMCAAHVQRMRRARFPLAIGSQTWLSDLGAVHGPGGHGLVRLGIDPEGRARYCLVTKPSGNSELDRRVCEAMTAKARYEPALDSAGAPTFSVDYRAYDWNP